MRAALNTLRNWQHIPLCRVWISSFVLAGLTLIIAAPLTADACGWTEVSCHLVTAIAWLLERFTGLFWSISGIAARFLNFVLVDFHNQVLFVDNGFVQAGWQVVRDISNWFFIVFFLVSAISTILNLQRYNARAILPKLLILAVLVNFSLFITGFVINVSNVFMHLFIVQGAGQYGDLGSQLHQAMGAVDGSFSFEDATKGQAPSTQNTDETQLAVLRASFAVGSIGMAMLTIFVFTFLALLLVIRVVYLWVSLILSPLAFTLAIFPKTHQFFEKWSQQLVNQSLFGVFAAFFIWLSVYLAAYLADNFNDGASLVANPQDPAGATMVNALLQSADKLIAFVTIFVFLMLSMKVSKEMSGAAGAAAHSATKSALVGVGLMGGIAAGRKGLKLAGQGAQAGGRRAYRNVGAASEGGALADRVNRMMLRTPVLRRFGQQMSGTQREYREGRKARIDARELDKMPRRDLTENAQGAVESASRGGVMTDEKAMSVLAAARKGIRIDMDDTAFERIHDKLRETGQEGDFVAAYAHTAAENGMLPDQQENDSTEEALQRYYSSGAGRRNIHLLQAGELADDVDAEGNVTTDRSAARNGVTNAMATGNINAGQSLRRMEQSENFEGYQALLHAMNERFADPNTQEVRVNVDVRQLDAQGNFSDAQTTRVNNSVRAVLGAPTQQALMQPPVVQGEAVQGQVIEPVGRVSEADAREGRRQIDPDQNNQGNA